MQYSINELNSTITKSPLFLERFIPKEKSCYTYCLPDSSPPSSSVSPGRLRNKVPSSSFLLTTKTLFYSILFPPPPSYSALFCTWPGGDGKRDTLAVDNNVFPHSWNLRASHVSGGGFAAIWFCCGTSKYSRVVLSLWHIDKGLLCYYYIKHSEDVVMCLCREEHVQFIHLSSKLAAEDYFPHLHCIDVHVKSKNFNLMVAPEETSGYRLIH